MYDKNTLIWKDFDKMHVDFPETKEDTFLAGIERFNENRFRREYTVFRMNHFASRIIQLGEKFELPYNSILHVADNFNHIGDYSDLPRLEDNAFVQHETLKKYILHIRELNTTGSVTIPDRFILRMAGLPTALMHFRAENGSKYRYLNHLNEVPAKRDVLTIVNHNPLFRMKMFGRLPYYRTVMQILASIFNTCEQLSHLNKHQFVLLPWSEEVFGRQEFIRSRTSTSYTAIRHPDNFHYILMMHLLNYMWEEATTSIFSKYSKEVLSQITVVLQAKDRYVFLNLGDIKALNVNNRAYVRFVNQLNLLSILSRKDADHQEAIAKYIENTEEDDGTKEEVTTSQLKPSVTETAKTEDEKDTIQEQTINTLSKIVPVNKVLPVFTQSAVSPAVNATTAVTTVESSKKQETRVAKVTTAANVTRVVEHAEEDKYAQEFVSDLDTATNDFINNHETLTPEAKNYYKTVAKKYKSCTLSGKSIEKWLTEDIDISLTDTTLNEKQLGFIPDKSCLKSTAATLERDYVRKTYKRHIAGIISSFQKNGLFLTDVKEEKVLNTFDNYTKYSCSYEDTNGNKTTISFKLPDIDSNDRFVTDGKPQVIKKQRIALPIIKINDHEVSLSSNYNKTRVYRNPNRAHNYGSYIYNILNKKSTVSVVYGHTVLLDPVAYEYTEIASKFREINFTVDKNTYSLCFDYHSRLKHFNDKEEKLNLLESEYGVYFGKDKRNYFFVDIENRVYTVKQSGGENTESTFTCILDILALSLKEKASLNNGFSEWLDITILNGKLPVMFLLGYHMGLRKALDHLGIKYTIVKNKGREIIGEAGMESIGFTDRIAGDNPYGDHWVEIPSKEGDTRPLHVIKEDNSEDVNVSEDTTGNPYIVPFDKSLKRGVKPRLGNITFFLSTTEDQHQMDPFTIKVRAMVIEVKLGESKIVRRRITNYDGLTFKSNDKKLPKKVVEKAADYLNCSEDKIRHSTIRYLDAGDALPSDMTGIPRLTAAEYSKLTSKLNIPANKVGTESIDPSTTYKPRAHDVRLKFADHTIYFNRYPISKSLVAAGLDKFDLSTYELSDFESKDVYFRLLSDNGISPNLLKGIEAMFDLFIDSITYQVLKSMHEPTNFTDLLIRCGELLSTSDHKEASSAANYRIRGYEQFAAILYTEIAQGVAAYQKNAKASRHAKFSINPEAVYLRIIQNQSTMPAEAANPLEDVKIASNITYAGVGGRDGESFVQSDRKFSEDDIGILSEGTADSGKVGMNAMTTFDPLVANTAGLLTPKTPDKIAPANSLSIHSLMMPFSSSDDK